MNTGYIVGSHTRMETRPSTPDMENDVSIGDVRLIHVPPGAVHGNPTFGNAVININLGSSRKQMAVNSDRIVERLVPSNSIQFMPSGTQWYVKGFNPLDSCVLEIGRETLSQWFDHADAPHDAHTTYIDFTRDQVAADMGRACISLLQEISGNSVRPDVLTAEALAQSIVMRVASLALEHNGRGAGRPPSHQQRCAQKRISAAIELTEMRLSDQTLTVGDLAKAANLSASQFSTVFKAQTGESAYAFIVRRRTELAVDLVRNSTAPLVQIAHQCGFSSQSHMTLAIKRHCGETPGAMRR